MNFKAFMKKHEAAFNNYNEALAVIIEKRRALSEFYWQLGALIEYPDLNNRLDQKALYDPETNDQILTRDQLLKKYAEVKRKLSYPIIYDQEYRAAYKALLNDVYEDIVVMTEDALKASADALAEYQKKKAEYYNKYVDAQNARYALDREINVALFAAHDNGTASGDFTRANLDMVADPIHISYIPSTAAMKDHLDFRLKRINGLDVDNIEQYDPAAFKRKYDSEFAKKHQDGIRITMGIAEARKSLRDWVFSGKPIA